MFNIFKFKKNIFKEYQPLINEINFLENKLQFLTNEDLKYKMLELRKKYLESTQTSKNILIESFALTREVSKRTIGLRHYDEQLLGGLILQQGKVVEMKTGEGKTLASTLAVSLNALSNKGVHVVTVNDYLAERDQKWMGKIYSGLGLSSGLVKSTSSLKQKKLSYQSDITYLTNSELVFDFLRDNSAYYKNELVQRPFNYCVIDEIDSILIDEARTPLILSNFQGKLNINKLYLAKKKLDELKLLQNPLVPGKEKKEEEDKSWFSWLTGSATEKPIVEGTKPKKMLDKKHYKNTHQIIKVQNQKKV